MERRFRLTRSTDIKRVRRLGKSFAHPLLVLIMVGSEKQETRFGIIAGRSVGGAVQRNRTKRWMRESLRPLISEIYPGWDILLVARRGMVGSNFIGVTGAMKSLLQRAHLLAIANNVHQS